MAAETGMPSYVDDAGRLVLPLLGSAIFYAWMFQQREIRYLQQQTDEPITVSP